MLLIRHGQSHFNKHFSRTRQDPGIIDPALTPEGRRQVAAVARRLKLEGRRVERILASPYWRALETAEILAEALDRPILVEPLVRERAFFACDEGSPRSELQVRFPHCDFVDLPELWWPNPDESESSLLQRCARFRLSSAGLSDWRDLVVVSHWGFIRGLTGQSVDNAAVVPFDPSIA